jgi:HlyD family secretion protein
VRLGDTVTAGQLLADFQIDNLEQQLAQAKLSLETAKLNLNTSTTGSVTSVSDAQIALANAKISLQKTKDSNPWTQVASAKISLDSANASLVAAQRDYDDAVSRPENPASAINGAYDKLVNARSQVRSAQNSYDSAAQNYNAYKYQIQQAENSVVQAELNLKNALSGGGVDPTRQQAVLSAQLNVDQYQSQIVQSSLAAPIDGEILQVAIKAGDAVKAYDTVITLGRSMPREAIASLAFSDAQKLSPGLVGICQILNRPETAVQCVVRRIPLNSRDADQTTRVAASIEDFKPATGQLIDIQMPLQVSKNVLWLPPVAVRTFQNRTFVVIQTPNGPRSVDVTVGLRTTDRVEIKTGLKEGDIAVGP